MPIYEYYCTVCGKEKEVLQRMSDKPPICCIDTKDKGMKGEIKSLNSSIDKLEQIVKDTYGDEYPELPRFKATDFL